MERQMGRMNWIAAGLLASAGMAAGLALPAAAAAAAQASPDVDALLEGVARGEVAPVDRALAGPLPADSAATAAPALARLAAGQDSALRRAALTVLTSAGFANGDYAGAARAGRQLEE